MRRITSMTIVALSAAVLFVAALPRWTGHRTAIESEPFVVTGELPDGWTVDAGRVVPPEALRSACRVSNSQFHDREWKSVVAAALREAPAWRQLKKVGGHEAAEYRTSIGSRLTDTVFINLDALEPAGVAIWRFEGENSAAGQQCESEFAEIATTLTIERPASP